MLIEQTFGVSKSETLGIVWIAFWQSFAPIRAIFEIWPCLFCSIAWSNAPKHFPAPSSCSTKSNCRFRKRAIVVFEEEQLWCSKTSSCRVRRRAIVVFEEEQLWCSTKSNCGVRRGAIVVFEEEQLSCLKKSNCRVRRGALVVFEEEQTAEKSWGELQFGRKFVRNDRSDENYHLNTFSEPPGFKKHVFEKLSERVGVWIFISGSLLVQFFFLESTLQTL